MRAINDILVVIVRYGYGYGFSGYITEHSQICFSRNDLLIKI